MTLLSIFKKIVDQTDNTFDGKSLKERCEQLGIDTSSGYSGKQATDALYQIIQESLQPQNGNEADNINSVSLFKLRSELVYRYILENENPVDYLQVLNVIRDSCRQGHTHFPPFRFKSAWSKTIEACKNYNIISPGIHTINLQTIKRDFTREYYVADAAKSLRNKGCKISYADSDLFLESGLEKVVEELNQMIEQFGGVNLARSLFHTLLNSGKYSQNLERFILTRNVSMIGTNIEPQLPVGYLLTLALKNIREDEGRGEQQQLYRIVELAGTLSTFFDVQSYNMWEFHFQSGDTIIDFMRDVILWDSIFSISQCRPEFAFEMISSVFEKYDQTIKTKCGFDLNEFIQTLQSINKIKWANPPPIVVKKSAVESISKLSYSKVKNILDVISHDEPPCKEFLIPSDFGKNDFFYHPLIKINPSKYLLMEKSWCSMNSFESLASLVRDIEQNFDSDIGLLLEDFIKSKFTEKGISFSSGDYAVGKGKTKVFGESDLIIECDNAIIIIEIKKKVLTRSARSGEDTDILIDLSDSLLSAQIQTGKIEIILRENGLIKLTDVSGNETVVELKDREIERVALTHFDYGAFHDRTVSQQFYKALLTHSYGTTKEDKKTKDKFDKLRKKQKIWVDQYNKLHSLDKGFAHYPFFNCWFLSFPQMLELLKRSNDVNSFYNLFKSIKHLSLGTFDWYNEFEKVNSASAIG